MAMSITNQEIRNIDTDINNNNNNNNILINEEKESETEKVTEEAEKEGENSEKLHLLDEKQFLKFAPLLENKNNLEFLEKIRKFPLLYGKRFYPITEVELKYIKSYISKTLSNPMDEASTSTPLSLAPPPPQLPPPSTTLLPSSTITTTLEHENPCYYQRNTCYML